DNPVLDYFNRSAWRRWRRWGWQAALAPLAVIGWHLLFEYLCVKAPSIRGLGQSSALFSLILGGLSIAALAGLMCVASLRGVALLLRPDRVEPLFLTHLDPARIWAAAWVCFNRNLLLLGSLTLPVLLPCAALARVPVWLTLGKAGWLLVFANAWFLVFAAGGLQFGLRYPTFLAAGFLAAFLFIGAVPILGLSSNTAVDVPFLVALHPLPPALKDAQSCLHLAAPSPLGIPPYQAAHLSVLGWPFPYGPAMGAALAAFAAGFIGLLLLGPMRPALRRPDSGAPPGASRPKPRLFSEGFARWAENPLGFVAPARAPYTWPMIWERLYENTPAPLRRRRYLAKSLVAGLLWLLAVAAAFDFLAVGWKQSSTDPDALALNLAVLAGLGVLAGFHFAFGGADEPWLRCRPRAASYVFKIITLLACFWIAGASHPATPWSWVFRGGVGKSMSFVALALGSQIVFQLWASRRSRHAAQAITAGALHALAIWLGPFLVLMFSSRAPVRMLECVSLSPALALVDVTCGQVGWSVGRIEAGGGISQYYLEADWRWSAALLAAELAVFGALLAWGEWRRRTTRHES
ncbi:MAG: hypothetical protein NTW86_28870, partial [Candidatus Sumerlaeota bacterium]|nr:hypothetical protein [Candidatus Sumerlaeota bacterium]